MKAKMASSINLKPDFIMFLMVQIITRKIKATIFTQNTKSENRLKSLDYNV